MTAVFVQQLRDVVGTWGRPPDDAAKIAIGLSVVALILAVTGRGRSIMGIGEHALPRRLFLWVAAFSAALLSIVYIATYLRGGPRIIDATTYFLQGRALSHGDLAWAVDEPTASFRGRFLLFREGAGDTAMGGIFPPGYPLLLAFAFRIGAPMVVGPAIAAALVIVTYRLALTIGQDALGRTPEARALVEPMARTAAIISIVCAALRYHTADTMAHGATALGITLALDAALKGRAIVAGLALGAVVATRPVSAVAIGVVACWLVARKRPQASGFRPRAERERAGSGTDENWAREVLLVLSGAVPGIALLLVAQHSVTGAWLSSSQKMYYALSDGLPDCFRWGFGRGTGCLYEHGDFVEARLGKGYGLVEAAGTTLRRLRMHLLDVANLEPLALLLFVPLARLRGETKRSPAVVAALVLVLGHVLAYAGFYFDGNYPGGGARLFADVLPVEHVLLAVAVARIAGAERAVRGGFALASVMLVGFAVHAVFGHIQLAERDGGRPMFEPDLLARANITTGLVFVETDHGFALGHDPDARIKSGFVIARLHNDDRDRLLFDHLDHPPTYLYKRNVPDAVAGQGPPLAAPVVVPWAPPALGEPARFEAEAEWPALAQKGGFAVPVSGDACLSGARALALTPSPLDGHATATITVPVPVAGRYFVALRVANGSKVPHTASRGAKLPTGAITFGGMHWDWADSGGTDCSELPVREVTLAPPSATLVFEAQNGSIALDRVTLKRIP